MLECLGIAPVVADLAGNVFGLCGVVRDEEEKHDGGEHHTGIVANHAVSRRL
jgi:hypothetical protein